jgi:hypothetical protein
MPVLLAVAPVVAAAVVVAGPAAARLVDRVWPPIGGGAGETTASRDERPAGTR